MAALHQHRLWPQHQQRLGLSDHVTALDGCCLAQKMCRFRQVGGHNRSQRQQRVPQGGDSIVSQQRRAALGDHHRIEHNRHGGVLAQSVSHRLRDTGRGKHPDLDRVDANIGEKRGNLVADKRRGDQMNTAHALRVLRGERGKRRHRIGAIGRDCLDVSLNAQPRRKGPIRQWRERYGS